MSDLEEKGGVKPTLSAPTDAEFNAGAKVRLTRVGFTNAEWSPHGLQYNVAFDENDQAVMLKSHYDLWVADGARAAGISAEDLPAPRKKTATKKESK